LAVVQYPKLELEGLEGLEVGAILPEALALLVRGIMALLKVLLLMALVVAAAQAPLRSRLRIPPNHPAAVLVLLQVLLE
jgi:hypothetical protein